MKPQTEAPSRSLLDEARHELRSQSVFWTIDHPTEQMKDEGRRSMLGFKRRPFSEITAAENLEGSRESLAHSRNILEASKAKKHPMEIADIAQRMRVMVQNTALHEFFEQVLREIFTGDEVRAYHEVMHWRGYVEQYGREAETERNRKPDSRLPREREPGEDWDDVAIA
jgi:hypothetical protein